MQPKRDPDFDYYRRVEEDAEDRCQANDSRGQCWLVQVPGGKYCMIHGGNKTLEAQEKSNIASYRLAKWQNRIEHHADHSQIKSLRAEIGILRMVLEERLNQCENNMDLLLHSGPINDMVARIQSTVMSCNKLESNLGDLLDRSTITHFANQVINIIGEHVEDSSVLSTIADKILEALEGRE